MRRLTAILLAALFFAAPFVAGRNPSRRGVPPAEVPDADPYTEGIKLLSIRGDSAAAAAAFRKALQRDPDHAPSYYALAANGLCDNPDSAAEMARRAYSLDSANLWYLRLYGQSLILADRYAEALEVYRRLRVEDPRDADNYRLLAALYEQNADPYMALSTLDSAETHLGRIPYLSGMKRRLYVLTRQTDKAVAEAKALLAEAPYDLDNRIALADLYGRTGNDSLARAEYDRAMQIDSTNVGLLMSLSDYYSARRDYRGMLGVARRLFLTEDFPLESKIQRFNQFTSDRQFYGKNYLQINELASILAMLHPDDHRVVELYARHLVASGEIEQALAHYKLHLDNPPSEEFYRTVIDIESYLQRPDSVDRYVGRALELFPGKIGFHLARGNMYNYAERYEEAVRIYTRALRYAETDSVRSAVWGLIGDTWHQQSLRERREGRGAKQMKRCYAAYEKGLRYDADNALLLNNYAYFLAVEGKQTDRAVEMAAKAVALTDSNPTYLDTYAWALFRAGEKEKALKIIRQAVALDGQQSPELLVHCGDILAATGNRVMAEIYWRKALEKGYDAPSIERRFIRDDNP